MSTLFFFFIVFISNVLYPYVEEGFSPVLTVLYYVRRTKKMYILLF